MTAARTPLVSVLTPSFEQGRWLADNLASVARQDYPHVEHVVADGGSTDDTIALLERADARVRWVSEPDDGQSDALNKAFARSSGEIVGWLNSDDAYFSRTAVSDAVRVFEREPDVVLVYGHSALVDGSGRLMHFNWAPPFSRRLLRMHNFIVQPAAFVRRSALDGALVDERLQYSMDRELWLRLGARGEVRRVPRVLAVDRHHAARKSYTRPDLYRADHAVIREAYDVPALGSARARIKLAKVGCRIAGAGLALRPGVRRDVACSLEQTSSAGLLARQVLLPRRVIAD